MVAFYKHNIASWRGGTAQISDRAYRVYHVLVEEMMLQEGPVALHERSLAGLSNRSTRDLRAALNELCDAGKIRIEDGKIHNERAAKELVAIRENRENAAKGGRKVREDSANGPRTLDEHEPKAPRNGDEAEGKRKDFKGHFEAPLAPANKPKREEKSREECYTREDKLALDKRLVALFNQTGRQSPPMHQTEIWLAQGYDANLIASVVAARLSSMAATKSVALSYFDNAILEAHQKRAPTPKAPAAPAGPTVEFKSGRTWPAGFIIQALHDFRTSGGYWPRTALGPPPHDDGCDVPDDLVARYVDQPGEVAA